LKLSLGPAPTTWGKSELKKFYEKVAQCEVDTVFAGETICSKRDVLSIGDYEGIVKILKDGGKKVYLSSLALVATEDEFARIEELIPVFDGIEANTIGILNLFEKNEPAVQGKDLIIGPYLNIYNWKAAEYLKKFDPERLIAPFEIPHESISDIIDKANISMEILGWGYLPTAISWRCYSARSVGRSREDCNKVCFSHPEGMLLRTVDGDDLFFINGLQVLSAKTFCLIEHLELLDSMKVGHLRIEASKEHTPEIIEIFHKALSREIDPAEAAKKLSPFAAHGLCNGWFWKEPGWKYVA